MTALGPIVDDKPFHNLSARTADIISKIDARGGWPLAAGSLVLKHGTERECYFSKVASVRDEWNTSIMTADEYYWEKISQKKKDEFAKEQIRNHMRRAMP